ncbi:MAG: phage tail protein [Smithella sp.]
MDIKVKIDGLKEALDSLDTRKLNAAVSSALNKVAAQAKTAASKKIRETYNIPASELSRCLRVASKASGDNLKTTIIGTGKGSALSKFGAKQEGVVANKKGFRYTRKATKGTKGNRYGGIVTVEVTRGKRKKVSGKPKSFLAKMETGHIGVFAREGEKRLPIKELIGPGIATLLGSHKVFETVEKVVDDKFQSIFDHEVEYRSKK